MLEKSSSAWLSLGWASGSGGKAEQDESGSTSHLYDQADTNWKSLKGGKKKTGPRQAGVLRSAVEAKIRSVDVGKKKTTIYRG